MKRTLRALVFVLAALAGAASAQQSVDISELTGKAQAGDPESQFILGTVHDAGRDVKRDGAQAARWYQAAAEQGHAEAQNSLGSMMQAEKRYADARVWYERAMAQSHAHATNNLAYLYDLGLGVEQSRSRAFELYSQSADFGFAQAMWNLANMHGAGELGGPPDLFKACIWTLRASKFAGPTEQQLLQMTSRATAGLSRRLPKEQWGSCQEQAFNWEAPRQTQRIDKPHPSLRP